MQGYSEAGALYLRPADGKMRTGRQKLSWVGALMMTGLLLCACGKPAESSDIVDQDSASEINATDNAALATDAHSPQTPTVDPAITAPTLPPVATMTPTPFDLWGYYAAPITTSATEIPRPMAMVGTADHFVHILLLGSDARVQSGGYRTDSILILSINQDAKTLHLISIPRDLYVYIPGWRVDRINTVDARGGVEMLADTIAYNFGIEIDHWVRANFNSFIDVVDALGGIQVESTGNLLDECGGVWRRYSPGVYEMDGFEALCYVRMRKTSSDFDRLRRQQEVIKALLDRAISLDALKQFGALYQQFRESVDTDLDFVKAVPLIAQSLSIASDPSRIYTISIDRSVVIPWKVPSTGAQVLLPDYEAIQDLLYDVYESKS